MEEGQKLYYTIGEVSALLSENTSLVRFWSDTFSAFIKPVRNKKGNRLFTAKDVENFKLIHHFVKDLGMTLDGAKLRMKQNATGEDKRLEVISRLKQIRAKLLAVTDENPEDEFEILTDLEDGEEEN
ncbi:MAG: MerR family transcriptional regulator [Bacteroidales bacterium]|nr:MerR family transcriptional regulator [Bacteroidales bacterium]